MEITGNTRLFCLLGDPVAHSKSPAMMNAAFRALKIDAVYVALRAAPGDLSHGVRAISALGFSGANVTAPHKQAIGAFLDELSPTAQSTGSVNTIVNENGRLMGHSTDGVGLVDAVEQHLKAKIAGKIVFIFGAGGAARGVLPALLERGPARVVIANRTEQRAVDLAQRFTERGVVTAVPLIPQAIEETLSAADIVVNAASTPVSSREFLGVDLFAMKRGALLFDMNYNKTPKTVFGLFAEHGLSYSDGLPMLLFQGARSFWLWTKQSPPIPVMRKSLGL